MLHTELVNNVKIIRIDYGRANAIDRELLDGLIDETNKLSIAGLIITGTDRFFSAGLNLQRVKNYNRPQMRDLMYKFHVFQIGLLKAPFPVVAAINGHCIGGGFIIALNCDYRVALNRDYKVGLNEMVHGIRLPPIATERIIQLGKQNLIKSIPDGQIMPPELAHDLGLVDQLSSMEELIGSSFDLINDFNIVRKRSNNSALIDILSKDFDQQYQSFLNIWFSPAAQKHISVLVKQLNHPL